MPSPVITPGGPLTRDGITVTSNGQVVNDTTISVSTDQDVTFSVDGGTLSNVLARSATWTLPNASDVFVLTAENGAGQKDTLVVTVTGIVPPLYAFPEGDIERGAEGRRFDPYEGESQTRIDTAIKELWPISRVDHDPFEFKQFIQPFHDNNYLRKPVLLVDYFMEETISVQVVSKLTKRRTATGMTWSMVLKQV